MKIKLYNILIALVTLFSFPVSASDGYNLWLNYKPVAEQFQNEYNQQIKSLLITGESPTLKLVKSELVSGLETMMGTKLLSAKSSSEQHVIIAGKYENITFAKNPEIEKRIAQTGEEGFVIYSERGKNTVITAKSDIGVLYGTYHFLQLVQTGKNISKLNIVSSPGIKIRVLNHWDNLDGSIERGYAGNSLWDWASLPGKTDPRYTDYARANASIGINGTVLNNVNANPAMLTPEYLEKVAVLANIFRPYGLKVFLSIKFSSPVNIGGMETADPLEPAVQEWWKKKVAEVYTFIPDFGGFLVKANSEGQPGPQNYNRTHADGANMLADALKPFGGIVMWRAFVYDNNVPDDRAKQAFNEFKPFDGKFRDNVLVQVKNGAIDFQPREPFHPLFGGMPKTPLMMEFQITQEYLGHSTDLCYLAPLFKECLESDTYAKGAISTVVKVIDGSLENHKLTGIAGVANTGSDRNWTGHLFGQANWFAFGRLAWNHQLSSEEIAGDWIKMTFSADPLVVTTMQKMMLESREYQVNYMTPLGLHHIMGYNHHFGPGPWVNRGRADWTSVYYHRADSVGIGFNRTPSGSNATSQYHKPAADLFANASTCPDELLLWFHHLPWNYQMKSGRTLWDELCLKYDSGVEGVRQMQSDWNQLEGKIDNEQFAFVKAKLEKQLNVAQWWRNSCTLYFQEYSKQPFPDGFEKPEKDLRFYQQIDYKTMQ